MKNSRATGKDRLVKEQEAKREAAIQSLDHPSEPSEATPSTPPQDPPKQAQPPAEPEPAPAPPPGDTPATQGNGKASDTEPPKPERKAIDHDSDGEHDSSTEAALYKQRYETLQRKYDAEVPRYAQQVRDLKAENQELKTKVNQAEKGGSPNQLLSTAQNSEHYKKLVKEYDQDTADSIAGLLADLTQGLQPPEPSDPPAPESDFGLRSHQEFRIVLNSEVPGWEAKYDRNDDFIDWAESTLDPASGETMLALLNRAALHSFDTNVAKRIFSTFDRQANKRPAKNPGQDFIEPAGDGGEGKPPPEAPTFKAGDLQHYEQLLRRNKITRQQFDKFQADFVQAQNEGRITP